MDRPLDVTVQLRTDLEGVTRAFRGGPLMGDSGATPGAFETELVADLRNGAAVRQRVRVELGVPELASGAICCRISWSPSGHQRLLPTFDGVLEACDGPAGAQLRITGTYRPPLGPIGAAADAAGLQALAKRSVAAFLRQFADAIDAAEHRRSASALTATPAPDDLRPMPSEHWLG